MMNNLSQTRNERKKMITPARKSVSWYVGLTAIAVLLATHSVVLLVI